MLVKLLLVVYCGMCVIVMLKDDKILLLIYLSFQTAVAGKTYL